MPLDPAVPQPPAATNSVQSAFLRRIIRDERPVPKEPAAKPGQLIHLALARVAQDTLSLPLSVVAAHDRRVTLAELPELIPDLSLMAMIEGEGAATGIAVLSNATIAAVIEAQTTGKIARTNPTPRRPSRLDAAMTVDWLDACLRALDAEFAQRPDLHWPKAMRFVSRLADTRSIGLLMEDIPYRFWTLPLTMGDGGYRDGEILIILPDLHDDAETPVTDAPLPPPQRSVETDHWAEDMRELALSCDIDLTAVLGETDIPLSRVVGLKLGAEIPLPPGALSAITLKSGDYVIGHAKLGQMQGQRALRMTAIGSAPAPTEANEDMSDFPLSSAGLAEWRRQSDAVDALEDDSAVGKASTA